MRVLHVGKYYPPHRGGMEAYLRQLAIHQSRTMDVEVIVANNEANTRSECADGVTVTRLARFGVLASMPITPTMPWYLNSRSTDIVHLHTPNPGGALALFLSGNFAKLIVTHHSDTLGRRYLRRITDPFVGWAMERADKVIVTSERYLQSSEELQPYREKCVVVPLGIDFTAFEDGDAEANARGSEEYGKRIILAVGRLVPYKGFDYLIQSMKDINGTLLLVGAGPLRDDLISFIGECGVQAKVRLITNADDTMMRLFYRMASVFVMPSTTRAEAFGIVQLEAMASGIPVVNTDIPSGVPGVSVHGQTGFTVSPRDPNALAEAINILLKDDALRKSFGLAGRQRVREKFSVGGMIEKTLKIYQEIMQET